ncbi:MAG: hypothetical protein ACK5PB_23135 [Pirellula sp.]
MTTPIDGDLPDQLLSDPTIQAESPQREIIETLGNLTESWQTYVPRNNAEEIAFDVLLNSNAVQVVQLGAGRQPKVRLTITGSRWKALLEKASEPDRHKVVYMILKLAFESQPEFEPAIEVIEPPELIRIRQWIATDGVKGLWHATLAAVDFWRLDVDTLHKDIAFLLRQLFSGDPSEQEIRDFLFEEYGLLPSKNVSLLNLKELLMKAAAPKNSEPIKKEPQVLTDEETSLATEKFILDTQSDLNELLELGEQTTDDGTRDLPLSAPRSDGTTSATARLFAEPRASSICKSFLRRLREFDEKLAVDFESVNEGKLKTASQLALAIRRLLLVMGQQDSRDRQSTKQTDREMHLKLDDDRQNEVGEQSADSATVLTSDSNVETGGNTHDELPPPEYDPNSTDWILSETLCEVIRIKASTITEYRKPRKCGKDKIDNFGTWNIDCVGKFRRRVNGKGSVAYYRPAMSDTYKAKLAYAESQKNTNP